MEKSINKTRNISLARALKTIVRYLILIALYGSAYFAVAEAFGLVFYDAKVLMTFIFLTFFVYLTARYFRSKRKNKFYSDSLGSFLIYLLLSFALSFFLSGLVFGSIRNEWFDFISSNYFYRFVVNILSGIFLWFIILFVTIYPAWRFVAKNRGLFFSIVIVFLYMVGWVFVFYLVANNIFGLDDLITGGISGIGYYHDILAERIFVPLLKIVVGSLPLGWFYELYIGAITSGNSRGNNTVL